MKSLGTENYRPNIYARSTTTVVTKSDLGIGATEVQAWLI